MYSGNSLSHLHVGPLNLKRLTVPEHVDSEDNEGHCEEQATRVQLISPACSRNAQTYRLIVDSVRIVYRVPV